jgi:hypothetical protein
MKCSRPPGDIFTVMGSKIVSTHGGSFAWRSKERKLLTVQLGHYKSSIFQFVSIELLSHVDQVCMVK